MGSVVATTDIDLFKKDYNLLGDFFDFFCAKYIGDGASRTVYEYRLDPKYVVKIDRLIKFEDRGFHNVHEHYIYTNAKKFYLEILKFLTPIKAISKCGKVMLMRRTKPVTEKQMPKKIPAILGYDMKIENWGMMDGRVVCHDYANCHRLDLPSAVHMIKPKWLD